MRILKTVAAAAILLGASTAQAQVRGDLLNFDGSLITGTRTVTAGEVVEVGSWNNLSVSWAIQYDEQMSLVKYVYTFTGFAAPSTSHLIMGLSATCLNAETQTCVQNASVTGGSYNGSEFGSFGTGPGNPGMPDGIDGIKFDNFVDDGANGFVLTFWSTQAPMWGDMYLKGGSDTYAYNIGLANDASGFANYIATPDTERFTTNTVPEPSTYVLMGTGLLALGFASRRRRTA